MLDHQDCPSTEIFGAYVSGCLPRVNEDAFESHVAACSRCAQRLEEEACLEMRLNEIADTLAPRRTSWTRRWANATTHGVGAVAAAASVLLTLGLSTPWLHDDGSVHASTARSGLESRGMNDAELLSCVPAADDAACEEPVLIAHRDPIPPILWTELPEPIDPATCWSEDDSVDLICVASR